MKKFHCPCCKEEAIVEDLVKKQDDFGLDYVEVTLSCKNDCFISLAVSLANDQMMS